MTKRYLSTLLLIAYSALLFKVMVLKDLPMIRIGSLRFNLGGTQEGNANFFPFSSILPYLLGERGLMIGGINIVGNIVLLIPIGFLLPLVYPGLLKKFFLLSFVPGLAIEVLQIVLRVGIFDIDDIILNGLGVMIGYGSFTVASKMLRWKKLNDIDTTAANTQNNHHV